MTANRYPLAADSVTCPGESLAEWLDVTGITPQLACKITSIPEQQMKRLLDGVEPLAEHVARQLQLLTGVPAGFWLRLESNYRNGLRAGLAHPHSDPPAASGSE